MDRLARLIELLSRWDTLTDDEVAEYGTLIDLSVEDDGELYWTDDRLVELAGALATAADAILDAGDITDQGLAALEVIAATSASVTAEQTARTEADAQAEADAAERRTRAEALAAQVRGETEGDDDAEGGDDEGDEGGDGGGDTPDEDEGDGDGAEAQTPAQPVAAAGTRVSRVAARRPAARPRPVAPAAPLTAAAGIPGQTHGAPMTIEEFGAAMAATYEATAGMVSPLTPYMKLPVARLSTQYPRDRFLEKFGVDENMAKVRAVTAPHSITASGGVCVPLPPRYNLQNLSVADRPVRDEMLAGFGADRGGVVLMPSPVLADLDGSVGTWTQDNDADPGNDGPARKVCLRVDCNDPETFRTDAITKCLEFGNWNARTFPEQIATYTELAMSWQARYAESKLLTEIGSGSTHVAYPRVLGAARDVLTMLDVQVATMRNVHRMSRAQRFRFGAPLWLLDEIRSDLAREEPGSADERLATADAKIEAFMAARGVNVTWFLDGEAGQIYGPQHDGTRHGWHPTVVTYLYPEGSWLHLDGGVLDFGLVRDSTLNATNDFQMMSETFEGAAFVGIESQRITLTLIPDGSTSAPVDLATPDVGTS